MIIQPVYTTDSIEATKLSDYDNELLEYLIDQYGADSIFSTMNEAHTYYGTGGRFDQTGGSRVSGLSGFAQSLPSLAITSLISWPFALWMGITALVYRFQKNFEDRNHWLNRFDPGFWIDQN